MERKKKRQMELCGPKKTEERKEERKMSFLLEQEQTEWQNY